MPGPFSYGGSEAKSTVYTPTSTTGGANSPSLAGDGAVALNGGIGFGKKGKQDNSVATKVGNTTTEYKVAKGGTINFGSVPVGNSTAAVPPSSTVVVPGSTGSDSSGVLSSVASLVTAARTGVTGNASPVTAATVGKYLLILAFPVVALVLYLIFRKKKTA